MNKSYESTVRVSGRTVIKKYLPIYYRLNKMFDRCGEQFWYKRIRSDFFLVPLQIEEDFIVLPLAGKSVGTPRELGRIRGAKKPNPYYVLYEEDIMPRFLELTENILDRQ